MKLVIFENSETAFDLHCVPRLDEEQDARKTVEVVKFLKTRFQFETEINMLEFGIPPYCKFKEKDGVQVTVALDDWFGLSIDCNSKDFLEKLKPILETEVFADLK